MTEEKKGRYFIEYETCTRVVFYRVTDKKNLEEMGEYGEGDSIEYFYDKDREVEKEVYDYLPRKDDCMEEKSKEEFEEILSRYSD